MQTPAILAFAALVALPFSGCLGSPATDAPRTVEYTFYVHPSSSDTVPLYEKNDGNQSRAVAVTFQLDPNANQTIPGPEIRVKEGDTVIIHLENLNGLAHTLHLHGGLVPWQDDGADYLTQLPTRSGENYTYVFPNLKAGTYWYHCHMDGAHHIDLGMYGAFIVEERHPSYHWDREYVVLLDEWDNCHVHGNTDPLTGQEPSPDTQASSECYYRFLLDNLAQNRVVATTGQTVPGPVQNANCPLIAKIPETDPQAAEAKRQLEAADGCMGAHDHGTPPPQQNPRVWWPETNPVYNPVYNTFLINGHAFPDTPVFAVKPGETVLFRVINVGNELHSWHIHGHTQTVIRKDGYPLASPQDQDTIAIAPGERFDVLVKMDNPGLWMAHDQNGLDDTNDNVSPGGMMTCLAYDGFHGIDAFAMKRALDCNTAAMKILGHSHMA
ncbi:MAG: multicopper oxidase family protein [Thermoplasmatota archaeon]